MTFARLIAVLALIAVPHVAQAVQPDEILADPGLETRARVLSRELRCMGCQNQSIDDSDARLARDLRLIGHEGRRAGDTDNQVTDFLVARSGEFVLLKPRVAWHTAVLWAAPVFLLICGALILIVFARRRGAATAG